MSREAVEQFLKQAEDNEELRKQIHEALRSETPIESYLSTARAHGHDFTADECMAVLEDRGVSEELSPEELESVAGGLFSYSSLTYNTYKYFSSYRLGPTGPSIGGGIYGEETTEEDLLQG